MPLSVSEAETIVRAGAEALRKGDGTAARREFERVAATGQANAQVWMLLAHACKLQGDWPATEKAIDDLLALEPRSLRALILKGDCRDAARDGRSASRFYKAAKTVAANAGQLPADLDGELRRIDDWLARAEREYRAYLEQSLAGAGIGSDHRSRRFQQSLDILSGEKQIYLQQPSAYYFPELPQRQFYERDEFAWVKQVESATEAIQHELRALLMEGDDAFRPYLTSSPDSPRQDFHGLLDNPDWSTLYLWENGASVEENAARCPQALAAVQKAPLPHITTRAPAIFFSRLRPGARIPAHAGTLNARLICHLPLIVPLGCGFRVGNETRQWEPGKLLIFDDTIEHEAWNESAEDRFVLIFDIWRPELSPEERRGVTAIFEAVDSYGA